ncbi:MAG: MFS transporter [bacterium]
MTSPDPQLDSAASTSGLLTWGHLAPAVKLITVAFILANLGGSMIYDQLAVYLTTILKADVDEIGIFFLYASTISTIMLILGGWVSDAIGHFRGLALGSVLGMIGAFLMWWAPTWPIAMVCYTFNLMGMALVGPSATAAITELTPPEQRARTFGLTSSIFQLTSIFGPLTGGYLIAHWGWHGVFLFNACLMGCATLLRSGIARYETQTLRRPRWRGLGANLLGFYGALITGTAIGVIMLVDISNDVQWAMTNNLRSLYLEREILFGPELRGALFTVTGIAALPAMLLGGWLGDRIGELRTMIIGVAVGAVGYLLFATQHSVIGLALPFACWGIVGGLLEPSFRSLISKLVPRERMAVAYGTILGSTNLIALPATRLGPWLYDHYTPQTPFLLALGSQCVVLVLLILTAGRLQQSIATGTAAAAAAAVVPLQ